MHLLYRSKGYNGLVYTEGQVIDIIYNIHLAYKRNVQSKKGID